MVIVIRDQLTSLKSKLTPGEQFLLTYSARSRSGSLGQRMTALAVSLLYSSIDGTWI